MHFNIGTRASKLALWQAEMIADRLQAAGHTTNLVLFETKGDKMLQTTIAKIGSKGVFTEELEQGLLAGELDLAVHSAKDLQSSIPDGLELIAFTEREQVHDVVLSLDPDLDLASPGLVVGSSSTRRRAMLARHYPNISPVEARGNLQTRLQKLHDGHFKAMLLAYAGVHRMGFDQYIIKHLPVSQFIPPTGQGSVAVQCAATLATEAKVAVQAACNHAPTEACVLAERAYLAVLNGGCSIPVFAHTSFLDDTTITIHAGLISLDGKQVIETTLKGAANDPVLLGQSAAKAVVEQGALELLQQIRAGLAS